VKEISAGGVVYKKQGDFTQLLIIEDRYMRISLPKGKQESGETLEQTALREIKEETGIDGRIVVPLETIYYHYYHPELGPVDKEVHYYLVEALNDQAVPQIEEINKVQWMDAAEAWKRQKTSGYENNHSVLSKAFDRLGLSKDSEGD
jgi:8-oxo-dGTP pyrophosphatase MutT (NUDIX family)